MAKYTRDDILIPYGNFNAVSHIQRKVALVYAQDKKDRKERVYKTRLMELYKSGRAR